jgi:chloramphenicol-sensitive protein RarD
MLLLLKFFKMSFKGEQAKLYKTGLVYAILSYSIWGIFPVYWKLLLHVPPQQILAHRIVWSLCFLLILIAWHRERLFLKYISSPGTLGILALTAALIGGNWFTYIYAVNNNHIVDSSLGYYINPLVNILLGLIFLKERLTRIQSIAVGFAFAGVAYLTLHYGRLPLISLILAFSFGFYGLLRKKANLQSMPGLAVETLLLSPVALWYLWHVNSAGTGAFGHSYILSDILLILGGPVTAIPLFWFGVAATRIPLSTLGFIQYLSPTLQLLIGIIVFREPFTVAYMVSFILVWIGLAIYTYSVIRNTRSRNNLVYLVNGTNKAP